MDEYYQKFLKSLRKEGDLPYASDDEEYCVNDEDMEDEFKYKIPKSEITDLMQESRYTSRKGPPIRMFRPVLPVLPTFSFIKALMFSKEERLLLLR